MLAREAEAASWSQRRQIYGGGGGGGGGASAGKREHANPWIAPTMGFPPHVTPMPHHFRPLHVWGHPSLDQSVMPMWPKHLTPSPPPPPHAWPPAQLPPPADPSFWMPHHHHHVSPLIINISSYHLMQRSLLLAALYTSSFVYIYIGSNSRNALLSSAASTADGNKQILRDLIMICFIYFCFFT